MNNENNNGVIDFDDSVFLNNSSNENLNTTTETVNNNQALDASTLNVDDVFGTWNSDEVAVQKEATPISNDYNSSDIIGGEDFSNSVDSDNTADDSNEGGSTLNIFEANVSSDNASNEMDNTSKEVVSDNPFSPFKQEVPNVTSTFDANAGHFEESNQPINIVNQTINEVPTSKIEPNSLLEVSSDGVNNSMMSDNFNSVSNTNQEVNSSTSVNNINQESNSETVTPVAPSLQEALSAPSNQIEFNNSDSNNESYLPNNSSVNGSQVDNNNLKTDISNSSENGVSISQGGNAVSLDDSVSIGTVNNSDMSTTNKKTPEAPEDKKSRKKMTTPIIMLILIVVVSVGVIIIKRDTLMDLFRVLINK